MNYCPVCNHAAHSHELPGCTDGANRERPCGCTFSEAHLLEGEAATAAGRVVPFSEAMVRLRAKYRGAPE